MIRIRLSNSAKLLACAAVFETPVAIALLIDPSAVAVLLVGLDVAGIGTVLGRCFGIALLSLIVAIWPAARTPASGSQAVVALLLYNLLIAAYLGWLGTGRQMKGPLLWPAVAIHIGFALCFAAAWPGRGRQGISNP